MPCNVLSEILKSCSTNMGGIRQIWLWDMEDKDTALSTFTNTNALPGPPPVPAVYAWTAYALTNTPAQVLPVAYQFTRNSSNYVEEGTIDLVAGSSYVKATLTLMFSRREALKSQSILLMGEGQRYLGALVLDSNGIYWLFEDLQVSATGEGSGTARADGSKYSVTLIGETPLYAGEVSAVDAADLITNGFY